MVERFRSKVLALAALTVFLSLSPAAAAPVAATANASGTASVLKSLSVLRQADLDFGPLVVAGAGTAVIDPLAGTLSTTGAVTAIGATAHPASFIATGSRNSVVNIRIPSAAVIMTRVGGTETLSVSTWTLDGKSNRKVPPNSTLPFAVGATVTIPAGQAEGSYVGTFSVTVQYP